MAVTRRLRFEVLRRDGHTCRYCGQAAPDVKLTVDHVHPVALGGKDDPTNLVTACQPCNSGKTSTTPDAPLVDDVAADALRWAQARLVAMSEWRTARGHITDAIERFDQAWRRWEVGNDGAAVPRQDDWPEAVERWLDEGFTADDLVDMIPRAMRNPSATSTRKPIALEDRWRYYCGVVWRTLDQIEAATGQGLSDDGPPKPDDGDSGLPVDEEVTRHLEQFPPRAGRLHDLIESAYSRGFMIGCESAAPQQPAPSFLDDVFEPAEPTRYEPPECPSGLERCECRHGHSMSSHRPAPAVCPCCKGHNVYAATGRCLICWQRDAVTDRA